MRSIRHQQLADQVVEFYKKFLPSRRETYLHFKCQGVASSTLNNILNRYDKLGTSAYGRKSGPKPTATDSKTISRVRDIFASDPNISLKKAARKAGISETSVRRCKSKLGIRTVVRKKVPKRTADHVERCIEAARLLVNKTAPKFGTTIVIIDDETYCHADPMQIPMKRFVHLVPGHRPSDEQLTIPKGKFAKKYGVWQAIASDGKVSPPVFIQGTMNAEKYRELCLKRVLVPWIKSNYDVKSCILWPDLARYHYTREVQEFLQSENLRFISKDENAPNLPECRPIERFWALVKRQMASYKNEAENFAIFKRRWAVCYKRVIENSGENLFLNFREKLKRVAKYGPMDLSTNSIE